MKWLVFGLCGLCACGEDISETLHSPSSYRVVSVAEPFSGFPREYYKCLTGENLETRAKSSHQMNINTFDEFIRYRELALDRGVSEAIVDKKMSGMRQTMNEDMRAQFGCEWLFGEDAAALTFV